MRHTKSSLKATQEKKLKEHKNIFGFLIFEKNYKNKKIFLIFLNFEDEKQKRKSFCCFCFLKKK